MSIYKFSSQEYNVYNKIINALDNKLTQISLPIFSTDKILNLYDKAISKSKNGILYVPGKIKVIKKISYMILYVNTCPEYEKRVTFYSGTEFEIQDIISSAMKEADNVGRLMNVYKYFVDNFEYEEVDAENKKFHYTASPFLYKRAVCDGFSLAFSYVINRVGIECGVVSGYGTKESYNSEHMWNIVRLNGKYYHLDVTWDISTKSTGSRFLDYFLIDDALAMRDHIWKDNAIENCNDLSLEYYMREKLVCRNHLDVFKLFINKITLREPEIGFRYLGLNGDGMNTDVMLNILKDAFEKCRNTYSNVSYGYNDTASTGYIKIDY